MSSKIAGKKLGTIEAVKASLKKGSNSNATYIKHVPVEGLTVRFLSDPEQWFGYQEYYDQENKAFTPMNEGEILPDGVTASFRYLTNAILVAEDKVVPLKLAKTLANILMVHYEKHNTLIDRNYQLDRHGVGLDTTYMATPEVESQMNLAKFDAHDLLKVLEEARRIADGVDPFASNEQITMGDVHTDDVDTDDDEEIVVSEDDLFAMSLEELQTFAKNMDLDSEGLRKSALVDAIIDASEK